MREGGKEGDASKKDERSYKERGIGEKEIEKIETERERQRMRQGKNGEIIKNEWINYLNIKIKNTLMTSEKRYFSTF